MNELKYHKIRTKEIEKERDESEQFGGCLALVFVVACLIVTALLIK